MKKILSSEITPESAYLTRRRFIKGAAGLTASALIMAACGRNLPVTDPPDVAMPGAAGTGGPLPTLQPTHAVASDDLSQLLTSYEAVTGYNNYYEFSFQKEDVAALSKDFVTSPWKVRIGGLVNNPRTYDLDDLAKFEQEERIYRMRCVEAWSMVIPWTGFPLAALLKAAEPTAEAKYVRFITASDPDQMPGMANNLPWPYTEGLRLDEAMHDLTLLATGLYGKTLLPQNGAPIRLVVPWKYGFKSSKSIVQIDLVADMPATFWTTSGPTEYGFWANVNPKFGHPRWSQATERRIGNSQRVETLLFNGYAEEVASLYPNLDSRTWFF